MGTKRCGDEEDDLIQNILVRLPVVSLLRFKAVCKSWCALIQSSFFIDLHTTNTFNSSSSSSSNKFGSFILHAAVDCERFRENAILMLSSLSVSESGSGSCGSWSTTVYYGICGQCDSGSAYDGILLKLDNLGLPSCYQFDKKKIIKPPIVIGSCNGIICLYDEQPNQVSLWNPATRQFRILPKPLKSSITNAAGNGNGNGGDVHHLFAFGVDAETKDDYKVVLLSVFNQRMLDYEIVGPVAMKCICRVQVYSLSTDSWKLLQGITCLPCSPFPYPPDSSSELFYLNGCCFFMAKLLYSEQCTPPPPPKMQDRFIISLDLTKETITPIELPNHSYYQHLYLCYLGMKIALFTKILHTKSYDDPTGSWEYFQIWVFNEPRSSSTVDNESWAYLSDFDIRLGLPGERNIPRGISNDGVFALLETEIHGGLGNKTKRKMKLYNLVTNEMKRNFLSCDQVLSKAYAYKPSLVSIRDEAAVLSCDQVLSKAYAYKPSLVSIRDEAAADDMVIGKAAAAAEMDWK